MKQHVQFKNISEPSHEGLRREVATLAERHLRRHLLDMNPDLVHLYAIIEKNRHHEFYRVALRLHVPHRILVAREDGYELLSAMRGAFEELARQLERHLERVRRSDAWRRKGRRAQLHRLKAALEALPVPERRSFAELVQPHLQALMAFVRRELTYLQATGDLPADEPTVGDVVDETLVRAARRANKRKAQLDPGAWLQQLAVEVLTEAVEQARRERPDRLSLEARAPVDAMAQLAEDEIFEFYQPDEVLRIEDLLPAPDTEAPEEIVERQQLQTYVYRLLGGLPTPWRRAFLLHRVDGHPIDVVAEILGAPPELVRDWVATAGAFLREHLRAAGVDMPDEAALDRYVKLPQRAAVATGLVIELQQAFTTIAA